MASRFEGFLKSAPQAKPLPRSMLRQEPPALEPVTAPTSTAAATETAPEPPVEVVPPAPQPGAANGELSAWGDEAFDLQRMALAIRQNTEEVLDRVGSKFDEMMKAHLAKQEELARQHQRLVERLTEYNKRDSMFLIAMIGTMVVFAVIYIIK